jgi:hypothetical protein
MGIKPIFAHFKVEEGRNFDEHLAKGLGDEGVTAVGHVEVEG